MIVVAAVASCIAATWLRLSLGASAAVVPWLGLAWTLLFARHSHRAAFGTFAVILGAIDGLSAPAPWTLWPVLYVLTGTLMFASRRVLPVRGLLGELALGALAAALVRALALPFAPMGLVVGIDSGWFSWVIAASSTGAASAALVWLARHWVPLRMRLLKVS